MCLTLPKHARPRTAKKDIPCVKIVIKNLSGNWVTPYQRELVNPGLIKSDLIVTMSKFRFRPNYRIVEIGLHSIVPDAEVLIAGELSWFSSYKAKAVNCIIPKGAKYILGHFEGHDYNSYASDQLIYPEDVLK